MNCKVALCKKYYIGGNVQTSEFKALLGRKFGKKIFMYS